jgi:hypothetical protein
MERLEAQILALVARGDFRGSLTIHIGPKLSAELRTVTGENEDFDLGLL